MKYDFAAIEKKWQEKWEQTKPYAAVTGDKKPKFYGLIEFRTPRPRACTSAIRARSPRWTSSAAKSGCRAIMS